MTRRITNADLNRALNAHAETLTRYGLLPEAAKIGLDHGSKTYGRAFRLIVTYTDSRPGWSGHHRPPIGDDYLGMTKAEAYEALTSRTRHIGDVFYVLEQGGGTTGYKCKGCNVHESDHKFDSCEGGPGGWVPAA